MHRLSLDWHILKPEEVKGIAAHAPTNLGELKSCQIIPDQKVEEYGQRIVKVVSFFVTSNNLQQHLQKRPSKRQRTAKDPQAVSNPAIEIDDDDDDEFDESIDYSAIDLDVSAKSAK